MKVGDKVFVEDLECDGEISNIEGLRVGIYLDEEVELENKSIPIMNGSLYNSSNHPLNKNRSEGGIFYLIEDDFVITYPKYKTRAYVTNMDNLRLKEKLKMKLYHVTTSKKAKLYIQTGYIKSPVRGFDTLMGAMAWAIKTGKKVIYSFDVDSNITYKLPDHHNKYGTAYWHESNVNYSDINCEFSGYK